MVLEALSDPVLLGILAVLILLFFLGYLFLHRTVAEFRQGFQRGRNR